MTLANGILKQLRLLLVGLGITGLAFGFVTVQQILLTIGIASLATSGIIWIYQLPSKESDNKNAQRSRI